MNSNITGNLSKNLLEVLEKIVKPKVDDFFNKGLTAFLELAYGEVSRNSRFQTIYSKDGLLMKMDLSVANLSLGINGFMILYNGTIAGLNTTYRQDRPVPQFPMVEASENETQFMMSSSLITDAVQYAYQRGYLHWWFNQTTGFQLIVADIKDILPQIGDKFPNEDPISINCAVDDKNFDITIGGEGHNDRLGFKANVSCDIVVDNTALEITHMLGLNFTVNYLIAPLYKKTLQFTLDKIGIESLVAEGIELTETERENLAKGVENVIERLTSRNLWGSGFTLGELIPNPEVIIETDYLVVRPKQKKAEETKDRFEAKEMELQEAIYEQLPELDFDIAL